MQRVGNGADDLILITIRAADDGNPLVDGLHALRHAPDTKAAERGGDGGYMESNALKRRVPPWFIVTREDGGIQPDEQIIIRQVEHAVVAVEVRRDEDDTDIADGVVGFVEVGNHDEGKDLLRLGLGGRDGHVTQTLHGGDEDINAFVFPLQPSCDADEKVGGRSLCATRLGVGEKGFAGTFARSGEGIASGYEVVLEAVGRDDVHGLVEELFALARGEVADGGEAVAIVRGSLFGGVLADHIEFSRHLVAVVAIEIVVQRLAIARDGASDARGVCGEERADARAVLADIENGEGCLPLVAVHDSGRHAEVTVEALCHLPDGIGEEAGLVVVAIGGMALDTVLLPHMGVDGILFRPQFVPAEEYCDWLAGHLPTPYAYAFRSPSAQEGFAFLEIDIGGPAEVGPEENDVVFVFALHGGGAGGEDSVDAAHTITYLPRGLENIVRLHRFNGLQN